MQVVILPTQFILVSFLFFRLNRFRPILYRLSGLILRRLMSKIIFMCVCVCYEWKGTKTSNYFSCFLIFFCLKRFWSGISWALLPLGKFFFDSNFTFYGFVKFFFEISFIYLDRSSFSIFTIFLDLLKMYRKCCEAPPCLCVIVIYNKLNQFGTIGLVLVYLQFRVCWFLKYIKILNPQSKR